MADRSLRIAGGSGGFKDRGPFRRVVPLAISSAVGDLDEWLFRALNGAGTNTVMDLFMVVITTVSAAFIIVLFVVPLWLRGYREASFDFLLLLGITVVLTEVIKFVVGRPRPCTGVLPSVRTLMGFGCDVELDPSFPSGHASRAFALAAFVGLRFRWRAGSAAFGFAVLVGLSRIYLGVHWPSDVVAGALLGVGLALAFEFGSKRLDWYRRIRARILDAIPGRRPA
jgi:undecaprenyl-diphosphatase